MGRSQRLTAQFAVVGTETQGTILKDTAKIMNEDKAPIVRLAVSRLIGLTDNDELREGDTIEAATQRLVETYQEAQRLPVTDETAIV